MMHTRKVTILLEYVASADVLARLSETYPAAVAAHVGELRYAPVPMPAYRDARSQELGERLRQLYEQKEEQVLAGEDVVVIDLAILEARRLLRQGLQVQAGEYLHEGRYRLMQRIGKGGFATVWLAYDRHRYQQVAVKVLHGHWADDRQRLERFYRGAKRMAELHHPGIVRVIAEAQEDRGFHYFVIEYVPGGDLRQTVQRHDLTPSQGLSIIRQIGDALHYAHARGVIHRDVKPANVLLGPEFPYLTDFDLAWAADTTGGTHTGALGTFLYAAPEMMQDAKEVTPAADVYSLAMTTVYVLYGAEPAEMVGDRLGFLQEIVHSPGLLAILCKATERDPKRRFSTISEFCSALADPEAFAPSVPPPHPAGERNNRHRSGIATELAPGSFSPESIIGAVLKGFRVVRFIGEGAMGTVYQAEQVNIEKLAAIKFLSNASVLKSHEHYFLNQARAVNRVKHPGLVDIFDFGKLQDGTLFLIMEYLKGMSLDRMLNGSGGKLMPSIAVRWARLIAEPLIAVHRAGIIHRNIKPGNIMLVEDPQMPYGERVKILDFGVAVLADSRHFEKEGVVIGTPTYMAPEQGRGAVDLDDKVDVYALGAMLVTMIAGHPPFAGDNPAILIEQHIHQPAPSLSDLVPAISWELSDLVAHMLAKHPHERPTMDEVARGLTQFERTSP